MEDLVGNISLKKFNEGENSGVSCVKIYIDCQHRTTGLYGRQLSKNNESKYRINKNKIQLFCARKYDAILQRKLFMQGNHFIRRLAFCIPIWLRTDTISYIICSFRLKQRELSHVNHNYFGQWMFVSIEFYTDISCLGGVFAKYSSRETENFPSRMARKIQSQDWYFSQISLSNMIYLFNYTEYYLEHWLNK